MSKYFSIPLTDQQLDKFLEESADILEATKVLKVPYYVAGSYALSLLLGDKVLANKDIDVFICGNSGNNRMIYNHLLVTHSARVKGSKLALTWIRGKFKSDLQFIHREGCKTLEDILDSFDLSCAQVGIEINSDGYFFMVSSDIYLATLGMKVPYRFIRESAQTILRANKYATKFQMNTIEMFPAFLRILKETLPRLLPILEESPEVFFKVLSKIPVMTSGSPEAIEHLEDEFLNLYNYEKTSRGEVLNSCTSTIDDYFASLRVTPSTSELFTAAYRAEYTSSTASIDWNSFYTHQT